jgi:secreted trypsin-like serine protease
MLKKQIVGGEAAIRGQFPWQVSIHIDNAWLCGGSLILNNWVLTAAHCTYNRSNFTVRIGTVTWYSAPADGYTLYTSEKYDHPNYNPTTLNNDITLLKLQQSVIPNGKITILYSFTADIAVKCTNSNSKIFYY